MKFSKHAGALLVEPDGRGGTVQIAVPNEPLQFFTELDGCLQERPGGPAFQFDDEHILTPKLEPEAPDLTYHEHKLVKAWVERSELLREGNRE